MAWCLVEGTDGYCCTAMNGSFWQTVTRYSLPELGYLVMRDSDLPLGTPCVSGRKGG